MKKALVFIVIAGLMLPVLASLGCSGGGSTDEYKPPEKTNPNAQDNANQKKAETPQ